MACAQASKAYQHPNCHTELTTLVYTEADHKWKGSWKHAGLVSEEALQCCISGLLTVLCSPVQLEGGLDTAGWVRCRNPFEPDGFLSFTWVQSHGKGSRLSLDFDSQSSVATLLSGTNPCTSPVLAPVHPATCRTLLCQTRRKWQADHGPCRHSQWPA